MPHDVVDTLELILLACILFALVCLVIKQKNIGRVTAVGKIEDLEEDELYEVEAVEEGANGFLVLLRDVPSSVDGPRLVFLYRNMVERIETGMTLCYRGNRLVPHELS